MAEAHDEQMESLRKGFHTLIRTVQEQRLNAALKDIDRKIGERLSQVPDSGQAATLAALEKRLADLEMKKPPSLYPLLDRLESLSKRVAAIEASASATAVTGKIEKLAKQTATSHVTTSLLKKDVETAMEKLALIEKQLQAAADRSAVEALQADIQSFQTRVGSALKGLVSEKRLLETIASLSNQVSLVEMKLKKPPSIEPVLRELDGLNARLSSLKGMVEKHRQQVTKEGLDELAARLEAAADKLAALEKSSQKSQAAVGEAMQRVAALEQKQSIHHRLPSLQPLHEDMAAFKKKLAALELASERHRKETTREELDGMAASLDSLGEKVSSQERDLKALAGLKALRAEVQRLGARLASLEASQDSFAKEVKGLIPTKKLDELDTKLHSLPERDYEPLLEELERKRKSGEADLAKKLQRLESSMADSLSALSAHVDTAVAAVNRRLLEKETEIAGMVSEGDTLVNRKLNTQFLAWLGGLEKTVKQRVEENLDTLARLRHELEKMQREFARKKDVEQLEQHLASPLGEMNRKVRGFVREEVEKMEAELKKSQAAGAVDHHVLQREIDRIVRELERQRTATLEGELGRMVREGETLKRRRM